MFLRRSESRWYTNPDQARREVYGTPQQGEDLAGETGRERYYRQVREIRDELRIPHEDARIRWSEYYYPGGKPIKPVKRLRKLSLSIRASTTNKKTCPFCRDSIFHPDEGGPDYVCGSCQAHYHLDCFEEELGGACATLGCSTRRVISRARERIRPRTTNNDLTPGETQDLIGRLETQRREIEAHDRQVAARRVVIQREQAAARRARGMRSASDRQRRQDRQRQLDQEQGQEQEDSHGLEWIGRGLPRLAGFAGDNIQYILALTALAIFIAALLAVLTA